MYMKTERAADIFAQENTTFKRQPVIDPCISCQIQARYVGIIAFAEPADIHFDTEISPHQTPVDFPEAGSQSEVKKSRFSHLRIIGHHPEFTEEDILLSGPQTEHRSNVLYPIGIKKYIHSQAGAGVTQVVTDAGIQCR